MYHEVVDEASETASDGPTVVDPNTLLAAFERLLSEAVDEAGRDRIVADTTLDAAAIERVAVGTVGDITVSAGATVLATVHDADAETILMELRDHLLMGMTIAVLDVDAIARAIDADLTGQEVQQVLEGRAELTIEQLAEIMAVIESRKQ